MKILKIILIVLAILFLLPLLLSFFLKKEYAVNRTIQIDRPNEFVFDYIKYLKNQDEYSKWALADPNMKKSYSGTDGQPGFISAWESKVDSVGVGEQEIMKVTPNERIDYELRFKEPFESTELAYMTSKPIGDNKTEVGWGFTGKMSPPMNLMLLFMDFEAMIGKDFESGLANLKKKLESMPLPEPEPVLEETAPQEME